MLAYQTTVSPHVVHSAASFVQRVWTATCSGPFDTGGRQVSPHVRLGFAVKVLGEAGLPSHDARRWQSGPHLRTSLEYLNEILCHYSSPRLEIGERKRQNGRRLERVPVIPDMRLHADLIDPLAFEPFLADTVAGLELDVMLEAKGKDLALQRLREQLSGRQSALEKAPDG